MNKRMFKYARKGHKWLGYLLALQIFFWLLGGLVMSSLPLEKVHGKHLANRSLSNPFLVSEYSASIDKITAQFEQIESIKYSHFLESPIIEVTAPSGSFNFDGRTGDKMPAPNKAQIIENARTHLLINANITQAQLLTKGPREVAHKANVWQVSFDDWLTTTLYLDSQTGKVITVRSSLWRIFDFFWMLHIMDYDERENFNNPLLISFSATSVLFCITGIILLLQNIRLKRKKPAKRAGQSK
ncbi:MAG: hypothetical protein CMK65_14505 [Pseudoalteromonas sp.]|uniref:hypothetical protein n=1 Tax=Pseudoalteromonas sp. TaxID=53249 RepID=UPI000C9440E6|nr:hypothetical protein [Pseudoalteromonas sp.]MAD04812.1 hypothetical protein [Pseudoalteromonas sp.]|tara:strand:+ start:38799 stop:39524 length:726 start_codon:yes stop_codon:yes gene_type:complete